MKPFVTRILRLTALALLIAAFAPRAQAQQYSRDINVTTDQGDDITVTLGFDPAATEGIDPEFGEEELDPLPAGDFDIRFRQGGDLGNPEGDGNGPRGNGTLIDIQPGTPPLSSSITYPVVAQVADADDSSNLFAGSVSLTFNFDPEQVPTIDLVDNFGGLALDTTIVIEDGEQTISVNTGDAAALGLSYVPVNVTVNYDGALPVEFAGAPTATVDGRDVTLAWRTLSETGNAGFYVEHRRTGGASAWTTANASLIEGAGTATSANTYRYTTSGLTPGRYTFRVRQVDIDDEESFSPTVEVEVGTAGFALRPPTQNPFGSRTTLSYSAPESGAQVEASLYNTLGQRVRSLSATNGRIEVEAGGLASGVYFVRLVAEDGRAEVQTITLVR